MFQASLHALMSMKFLWRANCIKSQQISRKFGKLAISGSLRRYNGRCNENDTVKYNFSLG